MTVKVLKKGNVCDKDTWVSQVDCVQCQAELEFGAADVKRTGASSDHREHLAAYDYIVCPECGKQHKVVLPQFRKTVKQSQRGH